MHLDFNHYFTNYFYYVFFFLYHICAASACYHTRALYKYCIELKFLHLSLKLGPILISTNVLFFLHQTSCISDFSSWFCMFMCLLPKKDFELKHIFKSTPIRYFFDGRQRFKFRSSPNQMIYLISLSSQNHTQSIIVCLNNCLVYIREKIMKGIFL